MRILFHFADYPPVVSGVGLYMQSMARSLSMSGNKVIIVTARVSGEPELVDDGNIAVCRTYCKEQARERRTAETVFAIAREYGADLIEGADHLGECAKLIRIRNRPPILIKVHSSNALKIINRSETLYGWQKPLLLAAQLRSWHQCLSERASVRGADMLLTPSKRAMIELVNQGIKLPNRRGVIPNPIYFRQCLADQEAAVPTVLFVGRICFGKGVHSLPSILKGVVHRFPNCRLEVAGPDSYARGIGSVRAWLENRLGSLRKNYVYLGVLNKDQLDEAYGRAWVVIVPSRWDNFPQVVLEAMVRQRPIVSSPNGGMPEMLEGSGAAIADPDSSEFVQAVCSFLESSKYREKVGYALQKKASTDYSHSRISKMYISFVTNSYS